MADSTIKVAIVEGHQSIMDGYLYRLAAEPKIEVVATIFFGEDLKPTLAQHQVDVLLLGVQVPASESNPNPYPVLHCVYTLMQSHPNLSTDVKTTSVY